MTGHGPPAPSTPQIRVVDGVTTGGLDHGGLDVFDARLVEFTIRELERLLALLGGEGLTAFVAYLKVMRQEPAPDGGMMLVVDEFSGSWLQQHTPLTRNAAYRAQAALEDSGLMSRLVSRPGQGARGKQRASINPNLVLVPGGACGDTSSLRTRRPGPVSRKAGIRKTGPQFPVSQNPGDRETGPDSRVPTSWETGNEAPTSAQVSGGFPDSGTEPAGPTSSECVELGLLSDDTRAGLLAQRLLPAARANRAHVEGRLYPLFNQAKGTARADQLAALVLDGAGPPARPERLARYVTGLMLGELDPVEQLRRLHVTGTSPLTGPQLAERLVVGLVVGLGMSRVDSWGAWMHRVTRPTWVPKPNALTDRFIAELTRLSVPAATDQVSTGSAQAAATELPPVAGSAAESAEGYPDTAGEDHGPVPTLLDEALVNEHFAAAREKFPWMCREGNQSMNLRRRSMVVQMYLADQAKEQVVKGNRSA